MSLVSDHVASEASGSTRPFSADEIRRLRLRLQEIGRDELIRYFTLGSDDRASVQRSARGAGNRLGLDKLRCLRGIDADVLDVPSLPDARYRRLAGVGMDRLRAARRDPKDRLPRDHGHLAMVEDRFIYLREFAPHVTGR